MDTHAAASKAFVHTLAEGIRHGLKDTGVTVTSQNRIRAELGSHLPDALAAPTLARITKPHD